ncbi:MAG: hypothetical protein CM15mP40_11800 [Alphaproteobacteria bacterium]|nr:MAG: hypothetical protein CM15mP40_11800 [Alphaproteobacteria bacterium]
MGIKIFFSLSYTLLEIKKVQFEQSKKGIERIKDANNDIFKLDKKNFG